MSRMLYVVALVVFVGIVGLLAYIRVAPVTLADWHTRSPMPLSTSEADTRYPDGNCAVAVDAYESGATALCPVRGTAQEVLAQLDAIALATPRTRRIAGSPADGLITWETRSRIFGFPDYTTAQTQTLGQITQLYVHARQRYGRADMGVNAERLETWLAQIPLDDGVNP